MEVMETTEVVVLVYSSNRAVREDVVASLGPTLGGLELEVREAATPAAVLTELDREDIDCCVFDAEARPLGGMGLSKQIRDEYDPCPPVLLLVARPADSWLAAWSRAEAVAPFPIDPMALPKLIEDLVFIEEDAVPDSEEPFGDDALLIDENVDLYGANYDLYGADAEGLTGTKL